MMLNARYYAREAKPAVRLPKRVFQGLLPGLVKTVVNHWPKGVIEVISPWNYPMALSISDSIPALLAGNAVVVKPDSQTPYCTLANAELLLRRRHSARGVRGGARPGIGGGHRHRGALRLSDVHRIHGRPAARLAEQCGRRLIGFSAELGGKNPMIVTKGADHRCRRQGRHQGLLLQRRAVVHLHRTHLCRTRGSRRVHRQVQGAGAQHAAVHRLRLHRRHGQPDVRGPGQDDDQPCR